MFYTCTAPTPGLNFRLSHIIIIVITIAISITTSISISTRISLNAVVSLTASGPNRGAGTADRISINGLSRSVLDIRWR